MQKWETMILKVYPENSVNMIDGKMLNEVLPLRDFLNKQGQEGWEIAGVVGDKNSHTIYLKRPIIVSGFEQASSS